jgi:hypothetical protein
VKKNGEWLKGKSEEGAGRKHKGGIDKNPREMDNSRRTLAAGNTGMVILDKEEEEINRSKYVEERNYV